MNPKKGGRAPKPRTSRSMLLSQFPHTASIGAWKTSPYGREISRGVIAEKGLMDRRVARPKTPQIDERAEQLWESLQAELGPEVKEPRQDTLYLFAVGGLHAPIFESRLHERFSMRHAVPLSNYSKKSMPAFWKEQLPRFIHNLAANPRRNSRAGNPLAVFIHDVHSPAGTASSENDHRSLAFSIADKLPDPSALRKAGILRLVVVADLLHTRHSTTRGTSVATAVGKLASVPRTPSAWHTGVEFAAYARKALKSRLSVEVIGLDPLRAPGGLRTRLASIEEPSPR